MDTATGEVRARVLRTWADDAVATARALKGSAPEWGSEVHSVADGWLVLSGAGMYVNRAFAVGIDGDVSDRDLDLIVVRSRALGVTPAIEVTASTSSSAVERLSARGFVHDVTADVTALTRPVLGPEIEAPGAVPIRSVASLEDLRLWQQTAVDGWGRVDEEARQVSDAYAVAVDSVDRDGMLLAFDHTNGLPIACAHLTTRNGIATLGGMSTLPAHRGRGVQAALIRRRLVMAAARGCDLAATSASRGGASERNLRRHGFTPLFVIGTWRHPTT